jgi:hypothetical protein
LESIDTPLFDFVWPMAAPHMLAPEKVEVPVAKVLTAAVHCTMVIVAAAISTGLFDSAAPTPTPLTLDPEWARWLAMVVTAAVTKQSIATIVVKGPIDTGLLEFA